jgi:hypothetical protein
VVAAATSPTARSKATSVFADRVWTPLTFRTYWRAAASISSAVATGSNPRSVVMLRHIARRLSRLAFLCDAYLFSQIAYLSRTGSIMA